MSSISRCLYSAVAAVLLSVPMLADNGTVLLLKKNGTDTGSKTVAVGVTITFSTEGMHISSEQEAVPFSGFDAIEFSADRSAATPTQSGSSSTPQTSITASATLPSPDYPEPIDLGQGQSEPTTYDLSGATVTVLGSYVYSGSVINPQYVVRLGSETLKAGADYTAKVSNNLNAGTATITLTGMGNYTGSMTQTFTIAPVELTVTADDQTMVYGSALPDFTYTMTGFVECESPASVNTLPVATTEATSTSDVNTYAITVGGGMSPNYTFKYVPGTLTITPCDLSDAVVTPAQSTYVYTGLAIEPVVTVEFDGKPLTRNVDYTVSYNKNVNAGTAVITVRGTGNYTGSVKSSFTIEESAPAPDLVVTIDGNTIKADPSADGSVATFTSTNGMAWIRNYSAAVGDSVTLTVVPYANYIVGEVTFLGIIDYKEKSQSNGVQTYGFVKPDGEVDIAIFFEKKQETSIADSRADGLRFMVADRQTVRVCGASQDAPVKVFDARGQRVAADVQRSETDIVVRLASQPQGLYIIQVNNNTFKIYKK